MVERLVDSRPSTIDILDRVLDKGIVIDGWWRISLAGVDLISLNGRAVVASIETYLRHAPILEQTALLPWSEIEVLSRPAVVPGPAVRPVVVPGPATPPPVTPPARRRRTPKRRRS